MTRASPFSSLDKGVLHKSVVFEGEVHIVEEIQLLKNSESIKNLLLSSEVSDGTKSTRIGKRALSSGNLHKFFLICSLWCEKARNGELPRTWHDQHFSKSDEAACLSSPHCVFVVVWSHAVATCADRHVAEFVFKKNNLCVVKGLSLWLLNPLKFINMCYVCESLHTSFFEIFTFTPLCFHRLDPCTLVQTRV